MPELADVPGPAISRERRSGVRREGPPGRQEVLREGEDVVGTRAQGRQLHRDSPEPVEEVLAERALPDARAQVVMCRAYHAHVDAPWPWRSHRLHLARFQRAQQLDLKGEGQVADFVQEERPSIRGPEGARRAGDGAGEGALLVSEQLRLRQLARDGAAVQWNEGPA